MRQASTNSGEHLRAVVAEQRKEIARLQRALAKLEVRKHSEIAALKAKLAEEKKNKPTVIVTDPTARVRSGLPKA